jgi:glutamate synthase domain-containing protein 2
MNRLGGKSNTGEGGEDSDGCYDPSGAARSSRWRRAGSA